MTKTERVADYILTTLGEEIDQLYNKIELLEKENDELQHQIDALSDRY